MFCAAKLTDDNFYNNSYYAKIGGIATAELNRLELQLLKLLDFRLVVSPAELRAVLQRLRGVPACKPSQNLPTQTLLTTLRPPSPAPSELRRSKKRVSEGGDAACSPPPPPAQARKGSVESLGASAEAA